MVVNKFSPTGAMIRLRMLRTKVVAGIAQLKLQRIGSAAILKPYHVVHTSALVCTKNCRMVVVSFGISFALTDVKAQCDKQSRIKDISKLLLRWDINHIC